MPKTARLIVTLECSRHCTYCCNTDDMVALAAKVHPREEFAEYPDICITGGEPLLVAQDIKPMLQSLSVKHTVFLYTSIFNEQLIHLMPFLDGVQFTLHATSTVCDIKAFHLIQDIFLDYPLKSFRLRIIEGMTLPIRLIPPVWASVIQAPWLTDRLLPQWEDLFILETCRA